MVAVEGKKVIHAQYLSCQKNVLPKIFANIGEVRYFDCLNCLDKQLKERHSPTIIHDRQAPLKIGVLEPDLLYLPQNYPGMSCLFLDKYLAEYLLNFALARYAAL